MLDFFTISIAQLALGLFAGLILAAFVGYSTTSLHHHGLHLKSVLALGGRLLAAIFLVGSIFWLVVAILRMLGVKGAYGETESFINPVFLVANTIGFWGGIAGLIVGSRRARKSSSATQH